MLCPCRNDRSIAISSVHGMGVSLLMARSKKLCSLIEELRMALEDWEGRGESFPAIYRSLVFQYAGSKCAYRRLSR